MTRHIAIAMAAALLITSACSLKPSSPVWGDAERAVSALPVPDGYTDAGVTRTGDENCDIDFGCSAPSVTRTFRPTSPTSRPASCEALHAVLPSWQSAGYQFDRWNESASDGLHCNLAGSVDGLNVGADVSPTGDIRLSALALKK